MKQDDKKEGGPVSVNAIFILQARKGFGGLACIASLQAIRQWIPQLEYLRLALRASLPNAKSGFNEYGWSRR